MWTSHVYSLVVSDITDRCYENCLEYFPPGSTVLDIGIGNGVMIKRFHAKLKAKNLRIIGLDVNKDYLAHCDLLIRRFGLQDHITVLWEPVEGFAPAKDGAFDFILFSMSFMLLRDQELALKRVLPWLKPSGEIVFVQTMFKKRSWLMERVKPRLKYFTTIDFGKVIYEEDFFTLLAKTDLGVTENRVIKKRFGGEFRMVVATRQCSEGS